MVDAYRFAQAITDSHRLVLCAMARSLDRNVGYIIDALKDKVNRPTSDNKSGRQLP